MGVQTGKIEKVGVNIFTRKEEAKEVEFHPYNQKAADDQVEKLRRIKSSRNSEKVLDCLENIKRDAREDKNLMPAVVAAVKEYCTVGEIVKAMKEVYGEFKEPIFFK